jgi:hypothetical protein
MYVFFHLSSLPGHTLFTNVTTLVTNCVKHLHDNSALCVVAVLALKFAVSYAPCNVVSLVMHTPSMVNLKGFCFDFLGVDFLVTLIFLVDSVTFGSERGDCCQTWRFQL